MDAQRLDFWISQGWNVLFSGRHGVGKTTMILEAFDRAGLRWKYFSASTMDPWVDFIGVPKERIEGDTSYLDMVLPRDMADDTIDVIIFDEYNRAHKKVRNAVMELVQFKSINGRKFKNLKMVWAAINPYDEDGTYNVERLDPAEVDRFQIFIEVPYDVDDVFFARNFGAVGSWATSWWRELPPELKTKVSPRRLDYALQVYSKGGDLRDVLTPEVNIPKLLSYLSLGPLVEKLDKNFAENDSATAEANLSEVPSVLQFAEYLVKSPKHSEFFLPLLKPEALAALMPLRTPVGEKVREVVLQNIDLPKFSALILDNYDAGYDYAMSIISAAARAEAPVKLKMYETFIKEGIRKMFGEEYSKPKSRLSLSELKVEVERLRGKMEDLSNLKKHRAFTSSLLAVVASIPVNGMSAATSQSLFRFLLDAANTLSEAKFTESPLAKEIPLSEYRLAAALLYIHSYMGSDSTLPDPLSENGDRINPFGESVLRYSDILTSQDIEAMNDYSDEGDEEDEDYSDDDEDFDDADLKEEEPVKKAEHPSRSKPFPSVRDVMDGIVRKLR